MWLSHILIRAYNPAHVLRQFGPLIGPYFFTFRWVPPEIRVDYEVMYLSYMAPWIEEWKQMHTFLYELSDEDDMVPLVVYGERYRASTSEIINMPTHAWEITERLVMGGPDELVNREAVYLRGQLQEMTCSRNQVMRQCAEGWAQLETTMATLQKVEAKREREGAYFAEI
ncbi:hypothetical protein AMTR_s00160p00075700 [Amborella trichopoda]|uniref:Uncharacterized protein n=1 Tax=Amborella trichopoda TaxID=13333 RepID=W1PUL1_AMBTC|nr:hypothetical protein AMTR_s00160p00075700 [Amborella trichopoda]